MRTGMRALILLRPGRLSSPPPFALPTPEACGAHPFDFLPPPQLEDEFAQELLLRAREVSAHFVFS